MRYFAFFYEWSNAVRQGRGFQVMSCPEFPNGAERLQAKAHDVGMPVETVMITGLFEFKNEQDFNSFRRDL